MLADVSREKYSPRGQFQAFNTTVRALPALSGGGLFLRDEQTLKRFAVGELPEAVAYSGVPGGPFGNNWLTLVRS